MVVGRHLSVALAEGVEVQNPVALGVEEVVRHCLASSGVEGLRSRALVVEEALICSASGAAAGSRTSVVAVVEEELRLMEAAGWGERTRVAVEEVRRALELEEVEAEDWALPTSSVVMAEVRKVCLALVGEVERVLDLEAAVELPRAPYCQ